MTNQDQLPWDLRLWPRHELVKEAQRLEARVDELVESLAQFQAENRILREQVSNLD